MILVLHDNDKNTESFLEYLNKNSIDYVALTPLEIINDVSISDSLTSDSTDCIWRHHGLDINFKNIKGLYNRLAHLNIKYFKDYIEEDQVYVQNEWWAYLVYRINDSPNVVNLLTPEVLSGAIYQFPFVYKLVYEMGFKTPKHYISQSNNEICFFSKKLDRYIVKNNIYFDNNFRESNTISEDTIALIEYIEGDVIYVHVIDNKVWCTIYKNQTPHPYKIHESYKKQCKLLAKKLQLRVIELVFKQNNNKLLLHYISSQPNWLKSYSEYLPQIYKHLSNKLIKC